MPHHGTSNEYQQHIFLPIYAWLPIKGTLANSVDPDQTPTTWRLIRVYVVCIKFRHFLQNMNIMKTNHTPLIKELCLSKELRQKSPLSINRLRRNKKIFVWILLLSGIMGKSTIYVDVLDG